MKSAVFHLSKRQLSQHHFESCVQHLRSGGVIALPTDTVYGIGCNAFNIDAVGQIYKLKGRSYKKALPLLLGDLSQLPLVARDVLPEAHKLIREFWPGPLTLVFKTSALAMAATRGKNTVAVRIPKDPLIEALSTTLNVPLAMTSANPSGKKAPFMFNDVSAFFMNKISVLIDGGQCPISIESTVVDVTHYPFTLLREGAISKKEIENVLHDSNSPKLPRT